MVLEIEKQKINETSLEQEYYNNNEMIDLPRDLVINILVDMIAKSIPVFGSVFRTLETNELKNRVYELENVLSQFCKDKELEFIKTKNIIEKYLFDFEKLDERILQRAIELCETNKEKKFSIEIIELFSLLSSFELNDIYNLHKTWMINFEGDKIWQIQNEDSNEVYFGLKLKTLNKLIEMGIFRSFTSGMSYGSSSDNFCNIQVTEVGIVFLDYLYEHEINDSIQDFNNKKPKQIEITNKDIILEIIGKYSILLKEFRSLEEKIENYKEEKKEYKLYDFEKRIEEIRILGKNLNIELEEYYKKFDVKFKEIDFLHNYDPSKEYFVKK